MGHAILRTIVVCVAAGSDHTMCVLENGVLLAWGANKHGKLGVGDQDKRLLPTVVKKLKGVH